MPGPTPPFPNHAEPARMYPAAQPTTTPPSVDLATDFTTHYAAGGYPDYESAGLDYAAGQRQAAREQESRNALTDENTPGIRPAAHAAGNPPLRQGAPVSSERGSQ